MTTILLCAEGKHDFGESNVWCAKARSFVDLEGWLQPLIRLILGQNPEFEIRTRAGLFRVPGKAKPAPGHGDKSYLAKRAAALEGCDLVVFMVDADGVGKKRHESIIEEIVAGFDAYNDDTVGCIACVPLSASESWLLSDNSAWEKVSGVPATGLPPKPEEIWGERNDPDGDRPHHFFSRVCKEVSMSDNSETRRAISENICLRNIRVRCPISFTAFESALLDPKYG